MCLAIPGKIKEIHDREALVEYPGEERRVLLGGEQVKNGDFVMVQMGIVVKKISEEEAKISLKAWQDNSNS
jgi:hydrogenase expression/formation protein HypC